MQSKKALFVALNKFFNTDKYTRLKLKAVGNETFGRKSFIYVNSDNYETRVKLDRFLNNEGFKVNVRYSPGCNCSEVQVSYFKGVGWDE